MIIRCGPMHTSIYLTYENDKKKEKDNALTYCVIIYAYILFNIINLTR